VKEREGRERERSTTMDDAVSLKKERDKERDGDIRVTVGEKGGKDEERMRKG
jgi:hypothetical protein